MRLMSATHSLLAFAGAAFLLFLATQAITGADPSLARLSSNLSVGLN